MIVHYIINFRAGFDGVAFAKGVRNTPGTAPKIASQAPRLTASQG